MILTKNIELPQDRINYIQKLDAEMSAKRSLISFMISNGMDISNERFKEYQQNYETAFLLFETAKTEIEQEYVDKNLNSSYQKKLGWDLNYKTNILTISYQENKE